MMNIGFGNLEFFGLKFREDKSRYPWTSEKESEKIFEDLIKDGSEISRNRYTTLLRIQFEEDIHVKLSYSIVTKIFSYFGLGLAILLTLGAFTIPATVTLGISFISFLVSKILDRKVNDLYMGMEMNPELVKFLFENEDRETK